MLAPAKKTLSCSSNSFLGFFLHHSQDFFAMELFDGHLFVHLNLGTGAAKVRASRKPLNDGNWHRVELTLKNKVGRITVDGNTEAFESPGEYLSN